MTQTHCGHCHTCGSPLRRVLDGEEWCATCKAYRRYPSHGWNQIELKHDPSGAICPAWAFAPTLAEILPDMTQEEHDEM